MVVPFNVAIAVYKMQVSPLLSFSDVQSLRSYRVIRPSVIKLPHDLLQLVAMAFRAEVSLEAALAFVDDLL